MVIVSDGDKILLLHQIFFVVVFIDAGAFPQRVFEFEFISSFSCSLMHLGSRLIELLFGLFVCLFHCPILTDCSTIDVF